MNNQSKYTINIFKMLFPFIWALMCFSGGLVFCIVSLILDIHTTVYIMHPFIAIICSIMAIGLICTILEGIKDLTKTIETKINKRQ